MRVLWLTAFSGLVLSSPALASGGGGGGSMPQSPSSSAPQYDPAAEYRAGVAALEAKDYKKAKSSFDHVLSVTSGDANVQYLAGFSRTGLGDLKGARKFYARAAKLDSTMVSAWRDLGLTDAGLGNADKAEATLATIRSQRAACAETCPYAADLKSADEAVAAALASIPALPTKDAKPMGMAVPPASLLFASDSFGDGQYLAAVSLINERRYDEAITALKSAQQVFGAHPDILTYLGFSNRKLGRYDVAEGYYRAALAAAPGHRGATEYFGELMVERRDLKGARRMLAVLDAQCRFGCTEAEELRGWIAAGHSPHSL
jgi:tetratricopeptide (TPR) repeat protein